MNFLKKNLSAIKLFNLVLRIGGIGSKFMVFTLMSKHFDINVFGDYSLITSLITILIFVLGLDYYNFSIRDILTENSSKLMRNKIATTFSFYGIVYIMFIIIAYFVFDQISYIKSFIFLIIFLCITEHLSQEIYRFLIGFKRVLLANLLLFIRTMGWGLVVVYFIVYNIPITLGTIFRLWLFANSLTIAYILGLTLVNNYNYMSEIRLNYSWIKKGLKVCYLFFIATLSLKSIEYANRFIVDHFLGTELAGIFIFYSNISILITVYINTLVISFELPELIKSANTNKIKVLLQKFKKSLLIQILISSMIILVVIKPLLYWQNKVQFENYLPLIFFMIIAVSLMNYSLYYHFQLYIFHRDKALFKIMIVSGIFSLIITILFTYFFAVYGTAISFVISGILMYYLRYKEAKKIDV